MQIFRLECALIRGRCFCEAGLKITTKHVSNSLVTHERFVVLFFLPSCCINSLMSGQNGDLAGLKLHSSVMLTSPPHSHSWTNSQILACKSYIFVSLCKHNHVHDWKMTQGLVSSPPPLPLHFDRSETVKNFFGWSSCPATARKLFWALNCLTNNLPSSIITAETGSVYSEFCESGC